MDALERSRVVSDFLDDTSLSVLKTTVFNDGEARFTTDLSVPQKGERGEVDVLFVRRNTDPLAPKNMAECLDVHTAHGNPLDNLYYALRGMWCPALLQNEAMSENLPPRVQQLLAELESTLGSSVRGGGAGRSSSGADLQDLSEITSPADELAFWQRVCEDRRSPLRQLAEGVDSGLRDILGFTELDVLSQEDVADLVARSLDALNTVWLAVSDEGTRYPQSRMVHLMDMLGAALCKTIQHTHLKDIDVWDGRSGDVRVKLQSAIRLLEGWVEVPTKLTSTFWPGCEHPWRGEVHTDTYASAYKTRLDEVLGLRTLSDELGQLLSREERESFRLERLFDPLRRTRALMYNPYTNATWLTAVRAYEDSIVPVESAVARYLRGEMAPILDRPQLLLREFQNYRNLLERPAIRRALVSEREALLSLLRDAVRRMEDNVDRVEHGENTGVRAGAGLLGPKVSGIVLLRQICAKTTSMLSTAQALLNDIDGFPKFASESQALIQRIRGEEDGRYRSWRDDMEARVEDEDPALRLAGSLMTWRDGVLVVNFSEDLVRFLREVRQLDELGFEIPRATRRKEKGLMEAALEAERFYRYGMLLKKTANFYNSISEQIIDVQEQLLLSSLTAFVGMVSKPSLTKGDGDVSWTNPAECENYIRGLQDAAEKVSTKTDSCHSTRSRRTLLTLTVILNPLIPPSCRTNSFHRRTDGSARSTRHSVRTAFPSWPWIC